MSPSFTPLYPGTVNATTHLNPPPSYNPSLLASIQADIAQALARQSAAANYNAQFAECNRDAAAAAAANPHEIGAFEDAFSACMAQP